jgi:hypothetical protein
LRAHRPYDFDILFVRQMVHREIDKT